MKRFPIRRNGLHRVRKLKKECNYNLEIIDNFKILYK